MGEPCAVTGADLPRPPRSSMLAEMNRSPSFFDRAGTILAFTLVLVILAFGASSMVNILRGDWTLISFGGSEEVRPTAVLVLRQPTLTPFDGIVVPPTATEMPQFPPLAEESSTPSTPTPEPTLAPSATVTLTPTLTATETPIPTETPLPTETPTETPIPPTATPSFLFRPTFVAPAYSRGCDGFYIFGYVRDGAGNPLPGLRIRVVSEFGTEIPPATSKVDPPGWYDVLISPQRALWYVQIVDASNAPLSPTVEILNTGAFVDGREACWHQVDFASSQ